jgi:predicted nucleotide-binding protein
VKRTIFIGSSHEGIPEAKLVCEALKASSASLDPKVWTTFFEPGSLTFEALEEMLMECCAAVFVVRGDDVVHHNASNDTKQMPRGNVLLEFGLVAGRFGRHNVALCRFDKAELPSDLAGMTVIDMHREIANSDGQPPVYSAFNDEVVTKLDQWTSHLTQNREEYRPGARQNRLRLGIHLLCESAGLDGAPGVSTGHLERHRRSHCD